MKGARGRGIALGVIACSLAILAGATGAITAARQEAEERAHETLANVAELASGGLSRWISRRIRDVDREGQSGLADLIVRGALRDVEPWRSLLGHHLEAFQQTSDFRDVLVLDDQGRPVLSASGDSPAPPPQTADLVRRARESPAVVRGDIYRCDRCGHVHLEFATAIRDPEGRVLGFLVARVNAEEILFPHLLRWPTPSATAEILLIERQGDQVTFLSPLRHRPDIPPATLRMPVTRFPCTGGLTEPGPEGSWEGTDYRGIPVLAYVHAIPETPWVLIAQMDRTEALEPWTPIRRAIEAIALLAVAFVVAFGLWIHRLYRTRRLAANLARERALRLALSESEAILQGIGDGVIATDREGLVRRINPVAASLTGWTVAEALGRPLGEVFRIRNEETGQPAEDPVARVLATGQVVGLANHTELVARDGTARPIADSGAPFRDDQGALLGVVLVFRDQSERRARERAVQEVSERFERFFRGLPQGVAIGRKAPGGPGDFRQTRWIAVNPALARLAGRPPEALEGRLASEVLGEAWSRWVGTCHGQDHAVHLEDDWPLDRPRRVAVTLIRTASDECVLVVEDVTDRHRAERERQRMEAVAAQQQRLEAIGTLAAGVAHEINNPVQSILNYAEVLEGRPEDAGSVREFVPEIAREAQRIAETVRSLLGIARPGTDAISTIRPEQVWERALALVRTMLQKEKISVRVEVMPDLPAIRCRTSQVLQVLLNLLINARDALTDPGRNPDTPRHVLCRSEAVAVQGRPGVRFLVRDNGPGIPDDLREHLFEPFFTSKGRDRGTGLGLWISRRIAEDHGGRLWFESTPGEGTTFLLDLPLEEATDGEGAAGR